MTNVKFITSVFRQGRGHKNCDMVVFSLSKERVKEDRLEIQHGTTIFGSNKESHHNDNSSAGLLSAGSQATCLRQVGKQYGEKVS